MLHVECDNRRFGPYCCQSCHCANRTDCDKTNGTCFLNQCEPGWFGSACDRGKFFSNDINGTDPGH